MFWLIAVSIWNSFAPQIAIWSSSTFIQVLFNWLYSLRREQWKRFFDKQPNQMLNVKGISNLKYYLKETVRTGNSHSDILRKDRWKEWINLCTQLFKEKNEINTLMSKWERNDEENKCDISMKRCNFFLGSLCRGLALKLSTRKNTLRPLRLKKSS